MGWGGKFRESGQGCWGVGRGLPNALPSPHSWPRLQPASSAGGPERASQHLNAYGSYTDRVKAAPDLTAVSETPTWGAGRTRQSLPKYTARHGPAIQQLLAIKMPGPKGALTVLGLHIPFLRPKVPSLLVKLGAPWERGPHQPATWSPLFPCFCQEGEQAYFIASVVSVPVQRREAWTDDLKAKDTAMNGDWFKSDLYLWKVTSI